MQEHLHTAFRQSEGLCSRVDILEQLLERTTEAISSDCLSTSVAKIEHRLGLLEDELGHVCAAFDARPTTLLTRCCWFGCEQVIEAIEGKADLEYLGDRLSSQKRAMQDALRKRVR